MFEYLMPLLVMPTYDNTLLDQTCRVTVERQIAYGKQRGVPWGISECGYNSVDASLNYQYRAFGVPGLGLKRGLAEDLVVAPYASALALMVAPEASCQNLQRLAADGLAGRFGLYEAIDYTPARLPRGQASAVVRSFMAHHQGMILLSLAHLLLERPMQKRFEVGPAVQGHPAVAAGAHPEDRGVLSAPRRTVRDPRDCRAARRRPCAFSAAPTRRYRKCSCCRTAATTSWSRTRAAGAAAGRTSPSPAGAKTAPATTGGRSATSATRTSGDFWSTAHQPTATRPTHYEAIFTEARAEFRRRDHDFEVAYRDRRFAGRRHRAAPAPHHQPRANAADDRRHQLRGSRARVRCRRRAASGVLQSLRADRDHPAAAGHPVHAPAPLARRAGTLDVSPDGHPRTRFAGRFLRDGPHGVHRPRAHGRRAAGDARRRTAVRQPGLGSRSDRRDPASDHARAAADGDDRHGLRHGGNARRRIEPRRQIPGSASGGPRLRSGVDAQLGDAAADQCHRVRRAALCAPRQFHHLRQRLAARGGRRPAAEPARAVRALELRDLRRSADRAAADRRRGEHRSRAPAGAGARVLAAEGTGGGPRDLERGPRRLSAGPPGSDHGADRRRRRGARDGSTGRDLRAAGGADRGRGPHPAPIRGARHHHRPPGEPGGTGHPSRPRGGAGPAPRADPESSRRDAARPNRPRAN